MKRLGAVAAVPVGLVVLLGAGFAAQDDSAQASVRFCRHRRREPGRRPCPGPADAAVPAAAPGRRLPRAAGAVGGCGDRGRVRLEPPCVLPGRGSGAPAVHARHLGLRRRPGRLLAHVGSAPTESPRLGSGHAPGHRRAVHVRQPAAGHRPPARQRQADQPAGRLGGLPHRRLLTSPRLRHRHPTAGGGGMRRAAASSRSSPTWPRSTATSRPTPHPCPSRASRRPEAARSPTGAVPPAASSRTLRAPAAASPAPWLG